MQNELNQSNQEQKKRILELIEMLNQASKYYYAYDQEMMSNFEYDRLYDELVELEKETGVILSNSPTVKVGYEAVDELLKEAHSAPMLSLTKTKSREELVDWLLDKEGILSWKLDGLTIVLTYEGGELTKAVTRGDGQVGEVITQNARTFQNIPIKIPFDQTLTLRGEAIITYSQFEEINKEIEDVSAKYKNPRNLCSGSVRQLNSEITAKRKVRFYGFTLVSATDQNFQTREEELLFLKSMGFEMVDYQVVSGNTILAAIDNFESRIATCDYPSDGLVLMFQDIKFGKSLGSTAKFPRDAIAFKWKDELKETTLLEIEWSASRTGLINPVAIFEPVELEGTTVSRASVHNISIVRALKLGIGDTISVYKANMIIPQIGDNFTRSNTLVIPSTCPVCGQETSIMKQTDVEVLCCTNPDCPAKKIKSFSLFVSRDAMNIEGLSEATLEKLIAKGFLHTFTDLFSLSKHRDEFIEMEGLGEKSFQNLVDRIEKSKSTTLPRLIYSLGIPGIGVANAKVLCKAMNYQPETIITAEQEALSDIEGFGDVLAKAVVSYFEVPQNRDQYLELIRILDIEMPAKSESMILDGITCVITGSLEHYENRNALKEEIETLGGKVSQSVSKLTNYLINNDSMSNSSKNKKAKELGVSIITEKEFLVMIGKTE